MSVKQCGFTLKPYRFSLSLGYKGQQLSLVDL
nr:MAG TPA: hypothetical protein [Caudoviricetes sp.]